LEIIKSTHYNATPGMGYIVMVAWNNCT